ncbi:hypothetical protein [Microbacterium sp. XT11]|uniref:hypothetical protein n=1 Tax=Microbacterium sp. XT11 TaxID=367477 RepID=UPI00082E67E6|nr:hypothetical protein [Microbacterium sp. XT11]
MSEYTPTMQELKDYATSYTAMASEAEWDRALAAHDAEVRAAQHIVSCARCGAKPVVASDALNSDIVVCGDCGVQIGLHELQEVRAGVVAEEPEGEHVFIERYGMYHAKFGGIGGDVSSLTLTREAWKALGEADVLAVSVVPVEQGDGDA